MRTSVFVMLVLACLGLSHSPAAPAQELDIREWPVPWATTRPRDPFAESADSVWFVGQGGGYMARLDTASGEFQRVDLKAGSAPHNLIVGSDGIVWYAGNKTALIGRYDPASGDIEEIPMPDAAAGDPHTLVFDADESTIWFTVQWGNFMGRLDIATRKVDLVPSPVAKSRPYGIKVGADGTVWVVLFGSNRLASIDPGSLALTEVVLPDADSRPRRLEVTADGRVWYADYSRGSLGMYDPASGGFREWPMPQGEGSRPYGMASDENGMLWLAASGVQPNIFQGFDSASEQWGPSVAVPSGGGTLRHMHYHQPSGAVWFGADSNTIGRVIVRP